MRNAIRKVFFPLLAVAALAAPASAQNPILDKLKAEGAKVEFLGNAYGLDGWNIIDSEGGVQQVYTTAEGALVTGMLFSPAGEPETIKQLKAYKQRAAAGTQAAPEGAEKAASKSEKLYAAAEKSAWVALGSPDAPYLYVFLNTSCDHCQEFWKDLEPGVSSGNLQLRFVPYGALEQNRDGAAALLSVERPEEAWRAYLNGDKGALGKDKIKDGAYAKVDANTALANDWNLPGPPFTIYRRPADGRVMALAGRPENAMLLQAEMLK